jgi:hypothetical protein
MLQASRYVSDMQLGARPRRAVSETTFDGTLISKRSFETLRSEYLPGSQIMLTKARKRTISDSAARKCAKKNHAVVTAWFE